MDTAGRDVIPEFDDGSANAECNFKPPQHVARIHGIGVLSKFLKFLSTASTETIGGIFLGLITCTYLILGRIGLLLIGALLGVYLHAAWENVGFSDGEKLPLRRENSLDVTRRVLDWREQRAAGSAQHEEKQIEISSFEGFRPHTAAALTELIDATIRDYIKWWYDPIRPEEQAFPSASRQILTKFIIAISSHLSRKRTADIFLDFLTNSSSIVIVFLNEIASAIHTSARGGANTPVVEAINTYLASQPDSSLANILNKEQQKRKFDMVAEDILQNFLEKSTYECAPARTFLREMLAGVVLEMTLRGCSKAEVINQWIVWSLEDGEPVVSNVIEVGISNGNSDISRGPFTDIDGNVGNLQLAKPPRSPAEKHRREEGKRHRKRLSKAEEAMQEAMQEAQRLSRLIAEDDEKKTATVMGPSVDDLNLAKVSSKPFAMSADSIGGASVAMNSSQVPFEQQQKQQQGRKDIPTECRIEGVESHVSQTSTDLSYSTIRGSSQNFTSFDQILPAGIPVPLQDQFSKPSRTSVPLTLHNAIIAILDDSTTTDKGKLRSKPTGEFLLQVEPASSEHPGWMMMRKYSDFETLHEVLRRIAQISGVTAFAEQHGTLPHWKEHTRRSLLGELERYLRDACWYQPLAESEGMKRFLEKDQGQSFSPGARPGFPGLGWPTPSALETMGKGVLDVLTNAPRGAAEGGKAVGGAITGVFTNIGNLSQKRTNSSSTAGGMLGSTRSSTSVLPRVDNLHSVNGAMSQTRKTRASEESLRAVSPFIYTQPSPTPPMERRSSNASLIDIDNECEPRQSISVRTSMSGRRSATQSRDPSRASSRRGTPLSSPTQNVINEMLLPPPPSDIPDDYGSHQIDEKIRTSTSTAPSQFSPTSLRQTSSLPLVQPSSQKPQNQCNPLTEQETRMAVELLFAVITELYTLSSAWNIRRTLLNAAKTFLLRPGNPSLSSIQTLIQDSMIASNTSDEGVATQIRKVRENAMPTEEELKAWPKELSASEKDALRVKARSLLVERGAPVALTGVMGQAASSECLGKIFDCLQEEKVSRGLIFGLLLQGVRAVAH